MKTTLEMAREAGLKPDGDDYGAGVYRKAIEAFAALVREDAQRKPLTDDELADLWYKQSLDWMEFARAIEAAHGIKENT